jgi:Zn-dependent M28 family amino/carboxypeptidase
VKFVAFSGEEQGLLGSAAYADEAYNRGDQIAGVLNFDMIAWDGNGDDVIELHCGPLSENQALADLLVNAISNYGLTLVVEKITIDATDRSDHASFWDYNYPAVLAIEDFDDFNDYYHLTSDRVSEFDTAYYVDFTKAAVAGISILADPFIKGDANSDALINLSDAIYILNYLFKSGLAPDPLDAGDANCDGTVNLSDAIYLLNYLFKGGLPPGC